MTAPKLRKVPKEIVKLLWELIKTNEFMKIKSKDLQKSSACFNRRKRRKKIISYYKQLKKLIKKEAKNGKLYCEINRNDIELAVASRLLFVKSEGLKIKIWMKNRCYQWNCERIVIKWSPKVVPVLEEIFISQETIDDEEISD